jgi:hypothetical protein
VAQAVHWSPVVEMRPRAICRYGLPAATAVWLLSVLVEVPVAAYLCLAGCGGAMSVAAWRAYLRLEDGMLFQRTLLRRMAPFPLADVRAVTFHDEVTLGRFPHRELRLWTDRDARFIDIGWWHDWRPFASAVVDELSTEHADGTGRTWRVEIDRRSRERLEGISERGVGPPCRSTLRNLDHLHGFVVGAAATCS